MTTKPIAITCSMCRRRRSWCDVTSSCEHYAPVLCFPEDYVLEAAAGHWLDDWAAKDPNTRKWGRDEDAIDGAGFFAKNTSWYRCDGSCYADTRADLMEKVRDQEFLHKGGSDE